ncbi:MAG: YCF48-related protein [Candidatus Sulfotelmatobacter sp.]
MRELSKVVRERLKVKAGAMAAHPDADLLTAFAERSITERERSGIMEHLAQCGDCREVVALALPAEVEETVVAKSGVRSNWFRWPALRWAAVAIGIAVAVSVGTLEYRSQPVKKLSLSAASKAETVATLAQPASDLEMRRETNAPPPAASERILAKKAVTDAAPASRQTASSLARSGASTRSGAGAGGGSGAGMGAAATNSPGLATADAAKTFSSSAPSAQAVAPTRSRPAPPAVSETVEVAAASPAVETELTELGSSKEVFSRAKPPVDQVTVSGAAPAPSLGRNGSNMPAESAPNAAPRWTLAANGVLQRSFDGGTTWQDVNVTGRYSMSANYMLRVPTAERAQTEESKSKENKPEERKTEKRESPFAGTPGFRALAANGTEVWVGGSGGLLYHTVDAGNSWSRVTPSFEGVLVGGDITGIEFSGPQHVRIATSAGEVWTTGDGGQTWLKLK